MSRTPPIFLIWIYFLSSTTVEEKNIFTIFNLLFQIHSACNSLIYYLYSYFPLKGKLHEFDPFFEMYEKIKWFGLKLYFYLFYYVPKEKVTNLLLVTYRRGMRYIEVLIIIVFRINRNDGMRKRISVYFVVYTRMSVC